MFLVNVDRYVLHTLHTCIYPCTYDIQDLAGRGQRREGERILGHIIFRTASLRQGPVVVDSLLFTAHISAGTLEENDATKPF